MVRVHPGGGGAPGDLQSVNQAGNVPVTVTAGQRWEFIQFIYHNAAVGAVTVRLLVQYGGAGPAFDLGSDTSVPATSRGSPNPAASYAPGRIVLKAGDVLSVSGGVAADDWTLTFRVV